MGTDALLAMETIMRITTENAKEFKTNANIGELAETVQSALSDGQLMPKDYV